jgi:hypothetical protein
MLKNIIKTLSSAIRRSTMSCTKYKKSTIVDLCQHRHPKPSPTAPPWVTQRDEEIGDRGQDLHHVRKRWDRDETGGTSRGAAPSCGGRWAGMGPATWQERAPPAGVGHHQSRSRSRPSACALPTRIERESSASPPVAQVTLMLVPRTDVSSVPREATAVPPKQGPNHRCTTDQHPRHPATVPPRRPLDRSRG